MIVPVLELAVRGSTATRCTGELTRITLLLNERKLIVRRKVFGHRNGTTA